MPLMRDKRILITGASGFIGRHLAEKLRTSGARVHTLTRSPVQHMPETVQHLGDIRNQQAVVSAVGKSNPEFIFHLCAYKNRLPDLGEFAPAIETNLTGTLNLVSAAKSLRQLRSIIVVGTAEEYGNNPTPFKEGMREQPVTAYSFSKLCQTQLCQTLTRLHELPIAVLRPTIAYGPGQGEDMFLPALIKKLLRNERFDMTPGMQTRDFVHVSDVVDAMLAAALCQDASGEVLNIGGGQPVPIAEVALMIEKMLGKPGLVQLGALDYRVGEIMNYCVNSDKARDLLGWKPRIALEQGLRETVDSFRDEV